MDIVSLVLVLLTFWYVARHIEQRQRIVWLSQRLAKYQIESLMQRLNAAYLRALDEPDPTQRLGMWHTQHMNEQQLAEQVERLASEVDQQPAPQARLNRVALPWVERWWPTASVPLARVLRIHADGIRAVVDDHDRQSASQRAHTLLAEIYLLQYTCHWFCRSRGVATARLVVAHQTTPEQLMQAIRPRTRQAYEELLGRL